MAIYEPLGSLDHTQKHRKQIIISLEKNHRDRFPKTKYDVKEYYEPKNGRPLKKLPADLDRIVTMINKNGPGPEKTPENL